MRRILIPVLFLFASLAGPAYTLGAARVDAQDLALRFEPASHRVAGKALLTLGAAGDLEFKLHVNLAVKEVMLVTDAGESAVDAVPRDASPDPFLARYVVNAAGAKQVRIRYEGTLYDAVRKDEALSFVIGDDTRGVVGDEGIFLVEGSGFHPITDGPCRYDRVAIDVPDGLRAVTQGKLVSREVKDGRELTVFSSAIPVDGLAMQAGKYVVTPATWTAWRSPHTSSPRTAALEVLARPDRRGT